MPDMSRRDFAESVMTAALVPLLGAGVVPLAPGWWERGAPATAAALRAGELDALAEALAGALRVQYGDRLSEADIATVTRHVRAALDRAEQMRKVELANGDEPDFVFAAPPGPAA